MLSAERKLKIAEIISKNGGIRTSELSDMFNVSEMTVLRDLSLLEKQGVLTRVYGGAVSAQSLEYETPNIFREKIHAREKDKIASRALDLIEDGDNIVMDGSTTTLSLAKKLGCFKKLTVISLGLSVLNEISNMEGIKVISPGGELDKVTLTFLGRSTEEFLANLNAGKAFLSTTGVSIKAGLTEPNLMQAYTKKIMMDNSLQKILLIDYSKFGRIALNRISTLERLDIVITDKRPEPEYLDFFKKNNIKVFFD